MRFLRPSPTRSRLPTLRFILLFFAKVKNFLRHRRDDWPRALMSIYPPIYPPPYLCWTTERVIRRGIAAVCTTIIMYLPPLIARIPASCRIHKLYPTRYILLLYIRSAINCMQQCSGGSIYVTPRIHHTNSSCEGRPKREVYIYASRFQSWRGVSLQ